MIESVITNAMIAQYWVEWDQKIIELRWNQKHKTKLQSELNKSDDSGGDNDNDVGCWYLVYRV